jgi:hypothetical protein
LIQKRGHDLVTLQLEHRGAAADVSQEVVELSPGSGLAPLGQCTGDDRQGQTQNSVGGGEIEELSSELLVAERHDIDGVEVLRRIPSAESDEQRLAQLDAAMVLHSG